MIIFLTTIWANEIAYIVLKQYEHIQQNNPFHLLQASQNPLKRHVIQTMNCLSHGQLLVVGQLDDVASIVMNEN